MKTKRPHMPALTRTFATLDRCQQHPGELLTMGCECPRCDREAFQTRVLTASDAKEARKLQALTNVHKGSQGKQLAEQKIRTWIERGDPSKDASL